MKDNVSVTDNLAIVLPSLDPDNKFEKVVDGLLEAGFKYIVIVDDGSDDNHKIPFENAAKHTECKILVHEVNKGKGRALKDAFAYIHDNLPKIKGAITIDGDGQHLTKDIIHCGEVMLERENKVILGSRDFDQEGVPARSVAGNKFTAKAFKVLFGIEINDTQTGLRAIPYQYLSQFCEIEGERFEYETNMLLQMKKQGIEFEEVPIETVYDPTDYSSHYDGFKDSLKVGRVMLKFILDSSGFKYLLSSLLAWAIDNGLYYILLSIFGFNKKVLLQAIGTFTSSFVNFNMNKYYVFKSNGGYGREIGLYYALCIPRTILSILFTYIIQGKMAVSTPGLATFIKILVDLVLFIATYIIQKKYIFKEKN